MHGDNQAIGQDQIKKIALQFDVNCKNFMTYAKALIQLAHINASIYLLNLKILGVR